MGAFHKYATIFQKLHEEIQQGVYQAGNRLPSEVALSRRFSVSRPTVAQALRELQKLNLIERHAGAGSFVKRVEPAKAGTLGLIADGLNATEIVSPLSVEIGRAAQAAGWSVLIGGAVADRSPEDIGQEWKERGVSGVFFAPVEHHSVREAVNRAIVERLAHHGMAVVLLDRDLTEFPERSKFDLVAIDDFFAGFDLAAHLLGNRKNNIGFVTRPEFPSTTDLRLAGVRAAVARVEGARVEFCVGQPQDPDFVQTILKRHRCDALICSNDSTAAQLMQTLQAIGRRVPNDVAVAGFDDVRYAKLLTPPLTTMRQPCAELGATAVETMLSRLRDMHAPARRILLRAQLVERASTSKPASQARRPRAPKTSQFRSNIRQRSALMKDLIKGYVGCVQHRGL
ncbi:MAG: LacI family DNA-binding transcriptional regulator [Opitutaceae bacterium]|jgi:LacI family transcriptional regulator